MNNDFWRNVKNQLPRTGQKVIARYEGVYEERLVTFWMDYELTPHFGRIDEPDNKGSQPATHWKPLLYGPMDVIDTNESVT